MSLAVVRLAVVALAGLAAGALAALALLPQARERLLLAGPAGNVRVSGEALIGGPFILADRTGKTVTEADFRGRPMLVVFGSAAFPDVTDAALQVLEAAIARLGAKAERIAPVLVLIDGEGEAPARLQSLAARYPRLAVLTGSPQQIAQVLEAYRVPGIRRSADTASGPRYRLDRPPPVYVMGSDGRYRGHLGIAAGVDAVTASLAAML